MTSPMSPNKRLLELAFDGEDSNRALSGARLAQEEMMRRGDIVDRNGIILATNLYAPSLYADAVEVPDPELAADRLIAILPELNRTALIDKLTSLQRFVWLKRHLTPAQQYLVNRLGIPGLYFKEEEQRVYPQGRLLSHVVGYTDVDGNGIAGVEKFFDRRLITRVNRPVRERTLKLSVDVRVQHALRNELVASMTKFNAIGAAALVLDTRSGEVLALASLPDFDPNHPSTSPEIARFNRVTLGVYELGSVVKPMTVAMALEAGTVNMNGGYDARKPIRVSRFTIRDDHGKARWLTVPEILIYSSNIGAAKMALDVGAKRQRAFLDRLGMLRRASLELPEVGTPQLPPRWRDINLMTIAFGHGLAISPLQLSSAFSALVNGGVLVPPTLVLREPDAVVGSRVLKRSTSAQMRRLLRKVVTDGTGGKAKAAGYLVGGKTGTAEKAGARGYRKKALLSSFIAAFPMTEPRYVIYVLLDEPQGIKETFGYASGGWTAAPAISRIVSRIAPMLGVAQVDEKNPMIRQAMAVALPNREKRRASF
jgi:cell division protein FtsI (penicillin-binding protein 3)